jgi:hypothetical protein
MLDDGKELGMPDGVLINGKGPYRYNGSLVPDGIDYETIKVEPGITQFSLSLFSPSIIEFTINSV